ncbi:MAG: nucleoside triphosphate pyrophosphohydrolase family protein [Halanaerobiaceae bacterium]|nr:nucleoside triphosphate pyrophosphohydrolase family protein [Halanaerobiaceae bacterium]
MTFEEYQRLAQRTSSGKMQLIEKIENGLMGLNGESGEAIDVLKKHKFQGHSLDRNKIIEELGDVLWYIAETCEGLGVPMEKVAGFNIEKLKNRYPDGFSSERSINRKEEG